MLLHCIYAESDNEGNFFFWTSQDRKFHTKDLCKFGGGRGRIRRKGFPATTILGNKREALYMAKVVTF